MFDSNLETAMFFVVYSCIQYFEKFNQNSFSFQMLKQLIQLKILP